MLSRRQLLAGSLVPLLGAAANDSSHWTLRFEAVAARLERLIPAPLKLAGEPGLTLTLIFGVGRSQCLLSARVEMNGEEVLLPLAVWISDSHELLRAREALALPAFAGRLESASERIELHAGGRLIFRMRPAGEGDSQPAEPAAPLVVFRHQLSADWQQGPLGAEPVELWRIDRPPDERSDGVRFEEAAVEGDLEGWFARAGIGELTDVLKSSTPTASSPTAKFVERVDGRTFEPYAFRRYRSGPNSLVPQHVERAEPGELSLYERRPEWGVEGLALIEIEGTISREVHAALLPPPCQAVLRPSLKLIAIRGFDDPSLDEAWLLAFCLLENRAVWYAVAHFKPSLEGSQFGREVLGYPTKQGQVDAFVSPVDFGAAVRRHGRDLVSTRGAFEGFSTGTTLNQFEIATLRLRPQTHDSARGGELLIQPWYYQGLRKRVVASSLTMEFPVPGESSAQGPGASLLQLDAWHQFGAARVVSAMVVDRAALQRMPAQVVAQVDPVEKYYRDRCDGRLPWENVDRDEGTS